MRDVLLIQNVFGLVKKKSINTQSLPELVVMEEKVFLLRTKVKKICPTFSILDLEH